MKRFLILSLLFLITQSSSAETYRSENAAASIGDSYYWQLANDIDYLGNKELLKASTRKSFEVAFVNRSEKSPNHVILEVIRNKGFAQWHLQMLKNSKKSFQKFFNQSFQREDLILTKLEYDRFTYLLEIQLKSEDLSIYTFLRITDYGCIALHYHQKEKPKNPLELLYVKDLLYKIKLDKEVEFKPEPWWVALRKAAGSVVLLFLFLAFYFYLRIKNKVQSAKSIRLKRMRERSEKRAV